VKSFKGFSGVLWVVSSVILYRNNDASYSFLKRLATLTIPSFSVRFFCEVIFPFVPGLLQSMQLTKQARFHVLFQSYLFQPILPNNSSTVTSVTIVKRGIDGFFYVKTNHYMVWVHVKCWIYMVFDHEALKHFFDIRAE